VSEINFQFALAVRMHPCNFLPVLRASTSIIFQLLHDWSDKI